MTHVQLLQSGGGSAGGFNWEDVVSGGAKSRQAAEEAFYGFGDFFRDLEKDRCAKLPSLPCLNQRCFPQTSAIMEVQQSPFGLCGPMTADKTTLMDLFAESAPPEF